MSTDTESYEYEQYENLSFADFEALPNGTKFVAGYLVQVMTDETREDAVMVFENSPHSVYFWEPARLVIE